MSKNKQQVFIGVLILSMLIWGMSWSSAKVMSGYGSAHVVAYIRFAIVVVVMCPYLLLTGTPIKLQGKGYLYSAGAGVLLGLYSLLFFSGLQHGFAGAGGVLVTTMNPIMAFAIGALVSRVLPNRKEFIGLFIGVVAGATLLQFWDNWEHLLDGGNKYFILGALTWALMSKVSSKAKSFGNPLTFNLWMHIVVVVLMTITMDWSEMESLLNNADSVFWGNMLYFGIVNSTFATACYLYATSELGAEKASTFIFLVPVGAVFSSWIFLGEQVEWFTLVGGVLGVLAVMIINKR
ncbi:DMT family transporter [Cyclobacteriaceae bacterium]|nr:DMT family transporter [Cyclobacteriaceae bacterium]